VAAPPPSAVITTPVDPAPAHVDDVASLTTPETTTSVCTSTAPATLPAGFDDLLEQVDERAAIIEFDGGHDRETAERLADEMVMGRGCSEPVSPAEDVGVDHRALAARLNPLVDRAVAAFGGRVVMLEGDGGFRPRSRPAGPRPPGTCVCGATDVVDVPIHGGRSVRQDCRRCDRFIRFAVWHGKRESSHPPDPQPAASLPTFGFLPTTTTTIPLHVAG
jgi:hypothetical protein